MRSDQAVPLALCSPPCFFREAAIGALNEADIRWRIAFTSPSVHGIWAAVDAGLGITLLTATGLPSQLTVMEPKSGLPALPMVDLFLHDGGRELTEAVNQFKEILLETLAEELPIVRAQKVAKTRSQKATKIAEGENQTAPDRQTQRSL